MSGPLAPLFAQVREGMIYRRGGESTCVPLYPNCTCPDCLALRALSSIERHVQDMESALDPVAIAQAFHEHYERLAPTFGYETRTESAVPWENVPEQNRALMVATVGAVLAALPAREKGEE